MEKGNMSCGAAGIYRLKSNLCLANPVRWTWSLYGQLRVIGVQTLPT